MIALGIVVTLIALSIYPALVLRKYIRIMINILDDNSPIPENGGNDYYRLEGEEVSFRAADGHRLEGVILQGQGAHRNRGVVIFAHEFGSDRTSCLRFCRPLLEEGYNVFTFDFRGHGGSPPEQGYHPRQWPSDRERADMVGAIAFIGSYLEQMGRPRDVALFGISRGAGAAIMASIGIPQVKAIITDGAFSSDTTMEYLMKRFATIFARIRVVAEKHPPIFWRFLRWLLFRECARRFKCQFPSIRKAVVRMGPRPILFIHGEKDSVIPILQSQLLFDLACGPKELWAVPGAAHNQSVIVRREQYAERICRFLDKHLAAPSGSDLQLTTVRTVRPAPPVYSDSLNDGYSYARASKSNGQGRSLAVASERAEE